MKKTKTRTGKNPAKRRSLMKKKSNIKNCTKNEIPMIKEGKCE